MTHAWKGLHQEPPYVCLQIKCSAAFVMRIDNKQRSVAHAELSLCYLPENYKQTLICKQIHRSPNLDLIYGTWQYSVQFTYNGWKWSIALLRVRNDAMFVVKGVTNPETIAIYEKSLFG